MYSLMNSCPDIGTVLGITNVIHIHISPTSNSVNVLCTCPGSTTGEPFHRKKTNVNRLKGKLPLVSPTNVAFQKRPVQDEGESTRDTKGTVGFLRGAQ